jgi:phosphotransferase system enzyme I (PtsI)
MALALKADGADPALTETFVEMGIDELSMSPSSILRTRKAIRDMD